MGKVKSMSRLQARQAEKKVMPAIKLLSNHMHNTTSKVTDKNFTGYKVPCGEFVDHAGVKWQLQVSAVRAKGAFIKDNEIKPMVPKWALMFKLRVFLKVFIDKVFGHENI